MKERQNLEEEETQRFNGAFYLTNNSSKHSWKLLENSAFVSQCCVGLSSSGNISYSGASEGLDMRLGNK